MDTKNEIPEAEFTRESTKSKTFNFKFPKIGIGIILIIIIGFLTISGGFYRLDSGYAGVITRFGQVTRIETEEGFKFKIPYIEDVYKVNMEQRHKLEYGYRTAKEGSSTNSPEYQSYDAESLVIVDAAGDNSSLILTQLIITYKVSEPDNYLFNVDDVDGSIHIALESVLRDTVAKHSRDEALLQKQIIDSEIMPALQKKLNSYEIGVNITEVKTQNNKLLPSVEEAYKRVEQSNQTKNSKLEQAQKYRNTVIPAAEAEAASILEQAKAYKADVLSMANSEIAQFNALYEEYQKNPKVVKERYYIQTMQEFLSNNKIILDGTSSGDIYKFYNMEHGNSINPKVKESIIKGDD
ncbi:MAG: FtsH protease activity modulator HflK [Tissierellales bacterium]|jgi:membrane protease subunit HflK|nr:FtsH protease activity modulator HflK [Tissierellales bacterium]